MSHKPKLIVFDVNETLLNLEPLKMKVNSALGNDHAFDIWFRQLLHYSLVETISENYEDFSSIASAVFKMVAHGFNKRISDDQVESILNTIQSLPPHQDVLPALLKLANMGFKVVALTNGNQEVLEKQLAHAGIAELFDEKFSVEQVEKYKPHRAPYDFVLEMMSVPAKDALMIAAHEWDLIGAQRVGMQSAFVQREGKSFYSLKARPDLTGKTVLEIVEKLEMRS